MPSRKRNQGKARREAIAAMSSCACEHGCPSTPPRSDHLYHGFMNPLHQALDTAKGLQRTMQASSLAMMQRDSMIQDNHEKMELYRGCMIRFGTNELLRGDAKGFTKAFGWAVSVLRIENLQMGFVDAFKNSANFLELRGGNKRTIIRFFAKRISCSCLKEQNEKVKAEPKTGQCSHCGTRRELASLMLCGRCGWGQYCSKDCQVAQFPYHKEMCNFIKH